jgi:hypothetical protein
MMDMHLRAIAVDLDFVQPSRPVRRAIAQGWVARRDESGEWRALRAGNTSSGREVHTTLQRNGAHADSMGSGRLGSMQACYIRVMTPRRSETFLPVTFLMNAAGCRMTCRCALYVRGWSAPRAADRSAAGHWSPHTT